MPKIYYNKKIPADENTLALLHFDDENNIAKDECGNTWNVYGSPTVATTNAKFDKAIQFTGSNTIYLDNIKLGGADCTVDFWAYESTSSGNLAVIFAINKQDQLSDDGVLMALNRNGTATNLKTWMHIPGTGHDIISGITMNALHHYAYVYQHSTSTGKLYVDGVLKKSYTSFSWDKYTCRVTLGAYLGNLAYPAIGSVDEFRISNCARWTANFTPPTEPYEPDEHIVTRSIELSEVN